MILNILSYTDPQGDTGRFMLKADEVGIDVASAVLTTVYWTEQEGVTGTSKAEAAKRIHAYMAGVEAGFHAAKILLGNTRVSTSVPISVLRAME